MLILRDCLRYVHVCFSDQDEQFESWRQEFLQERSLRIVREREIMKETAERCKYVLEIFT